MAQTAHVFGTTYRFQQKSAIIIMLVHFWTDTALTQVLYQIKTLNASKKYTYKNSTWTRFETSKIPVSMANV